MSAHAVAEKVRRASLPVRKWFGGIWSIHLTVRVPATELHSPHQFPGVLLGLFHKELNFEICRILQRLIIC
jgi:hypothetical protein